MSMSCVGNNVNTYETTCLARLRVYLHQSYNTMIGSDDVVLQAPFNMFRNYPGSINYPSASHCWQLYVSAIKTKTMKAEVNLACVEVTACSIQHTLHNKHAELAFTNDSIKFLT